MNKLEAKLPRGGQRQTHGGYSFLTTGRLPEHRTYIRRYLTACRQGLINDLGGEENLSTAQAILIDRIISKLGCVRCIEEHSRETSVMVGNNLAPALKASYLAYSNSIRLDLQALGIGSNDKGKEITPEDQAILIKADLKTNEDNGKISPSLDKK